MDSLNFSKLQFEKANAIYKYRRLRRIANILRLFEICVVLFLICRLSISIQFPDTATSEYFRGVSGFLVSPSFVFLIGNAIIVTLFVKSGQFGSQHSASNSSSYNLYEEFLQNSVSNQRTHREENNFYEKTSLKTEETVKRLENSLANQRTHHEDIKYYEKKQYLNTEETFKRLEKCVNDQRTHHEDIKYFEKQSLKPEETVKRLENSTNNQRPHHVDIKSYEKLFKTEETVRRLEVKQYRRSHSGVDSIGHGHSEKPVQALRRSQTEKFEKKTQCPCGENKAKYSYPEDVLSNEEFRRTVEAFIARQQRFLREEDYTVQ